MTPTRPDAPEDGHLAHLLRGGRGQARQNQEARRQRREDDQDVQQQVGEAQMAVHACLDRRRRNEHGPGGQTGLVGVDECLRIDALAQPDIDPFKRPRLPHHRLGPRERHQGHRGLNHRQGRPVEDACDGQLAGPAGTDDFENIADLRLELTLETRAERDLVVGLGGAPGHEVPRGERRFEPRLDPPQRRRDLAIGPLQPKRRAALDVSGGEADVRPGADLVEQRLRHAARELVPDVHVGQSHHAPHHVPDGSGEGPDRRRDPNGQHRGQGHGHHEQGRAAAPTG
ncbi:MAG: hypothetical protein NTU94_13255 [Planctomycetota bacterium]|nr:hypothetical protein [Planctomycetota bacterium]